MSHSKNNELTEKKRIETIGYCLDRSNAICCLLLPCFDKGSQTPESDKTLYHSLNAIVLELSQISSLIESSDKKDKLVRFIGDQLGIATTKIVALLAYFEATCQTQPDDSTIYSTLNRVIMELNDLDKSLAVYAEVYEQA